MNEGSNSQFHQNFALFEISRRDFETRLNSYRINYGLYYASNTIDVSELNELNLQLKDFWLTHNFLPFHPSGTMLSMKTAL